MVARTNITMKRRSRRLFFTACCFLSFWTIYLFSTISVYIQHNDDNKNTHTTVLVKRTTRYDIETNENSTKISNQSHSLKSQDMYDVHETAEISRANSTNENPQLRPQVVFIENVYSIRPDNKKIQDVIHSSTSFRKYEMKNSENKSEKVNHRHRSDPYIDQSMCVESSLHEAHLKIQPSCNNIHEIDMKHESSLQKIGSGGWRVAWKISEQESINYVLKTLKFNQMFDEYTYKRHQVDAIISDRLTYSPYIVDIYGYCGQSVLNEFAVSSFERFMKQEREDALDIIKVAEYARDVALGLADLHHPRNDVTLASPINEEKQRLIFAAYKDLKPSNVAIFDSKTAKGSEKDEKYILKISDFNDAELLKWNTTSDSPCYFRRSRWVANYHSPEEVKEYPLDERVDIYSFGSFLFYLLTDGTKPYNDVKNDHETMRLVARGIPPEEIYEETLIPTSHSKTAGDQEHRNHKDEVLKKKMRRLMKICHEYTPGLRPAAKEMVDDLTQAIETYHSI